MKNIPQRSCVGCNTVRPKSELIRIIRTAEGEILYDPTGRMNGRGAYLCNDTACLDKAVKRRSLERSLKSQISDEIIEKIRKEMQNAG
ncbi:MAG: YlxR family protein [Eubacterium sp.]|nr:YlxR family protein [Eubacterium sp.]